MIRLAAAGGATLLLVCCAGPAAAGVDVDPAKLSPRLFIDAEDERPGTGGKSGPGGSSQNPQAPPKGPVYIPITACREDAETGIYGCDEPPEEAPPEDEREVTDGDVLRATREIGLPSLTVQIQPGEQTLVNVDTIFYAQPQPFARSVSLLGFEVQVEAEPVSYLWIHGDGTAATTTTAGRPYPGKDVTHRYREPAEDVQARVDVTYRVRYRVDGGPWQTIGQTLLASGPAAELDVKEAAPVMTTPRV